LGVLASCSGSGVATRRENVNGDNFSGGTSGTLDTTGGTGTGIINTTTSGMGGGSPGMGCQQLEVNFVPKTPTVFILVDRSGSMFDSMAWEPLKAGVLDVVAKLQGDIRFGFGAFTGEVGQTCPMFDKVPIALNNSDAIATLYKKLGRPQKGETPTAKVLAQVRDILKADDSPGDRYILFVTDGEPDYCDDPNPICPVDSVVAALQALNKEKINTFVFGLKALSSSISDSTLQAFANAGAGQPVGYPGTYDGQQIYYGCTTVAGWQADYTAAGLTGMRAIGSYASAGGTAKVFKPDTTQADLTKQIGDVVSGVKSCTFDLGGKIEVDLNQLDKAKIYIEGMEVPLSMTNGWRMNNATQLELVGDACTNWRDPAKVTIKFDFPCEIVIAK
jgi:hypothetical protein